MRAETVTLRLALSAEQSVIGGVLSEPATFATVREILTAEQFEDPACRMIFQAILDEHEAGEVSLLTVAERLERNGTLPVVGGFPKLVQMAQDVIPGNAVQSARVVRRQAQRAALGRVGARLQEAAEKGSVTPADLAKLAVAHLQKYAADDDTGIEILDAAGLKERARSQSWAVKSVIPENSVGMFFGASKTFKSFVALDYALHRCYGLPWLGRKTKPGVPVYIAAEGGAGIWKRIQAWHRLRHMDVDQMPMRVVTACLSLQTQASELREAIEKTGIHPSDIIIDTMSQTFAGEENSSSEVASYLRVIGNELRAAFAATVLIVHHIGHVATERPRGSSALIANTDFLFSVWRDEKELMCTVECIKQKDGDTWPAVTFGLHRVVLEVDEDNEEVTSLVARHISGAQEIIAAANKGGHPSGLVRLLQAIGTGAPEKEVRQRFYELMGDADSEAKKKAWQRSIGRAESQGLITSRGDWFDLVQGPGNGTSSRDMETGRTGTF